jgi:hypothetical protein
MAALTRFIPQLVLVAAVALAALLANQGIALAQQGASVVSKRVAEVPLDPMAAAWSQARAIEVPLTPQAAIMPRLSQASIPTARLRSLHDGERIAFMLEWQDATRDASTNQVDRFRDAAAILLSLTPDVPNICMGAPGQLTNLWHWKADWQEDIDKGFQDVVQAYPNFYKDNYTGVSGTPPFQAPEDFSSDLARSYFLGLAAGNPLSQFDKVSPVEELLSAGFGTTTHKAAQNVDGHGVWSDGRWRVVFVRPLQVSDSEAAPLAGRSEFPVAVAVWNGSNQEVGARKQLSSFLTVTFSERTGLEWPQLLMIAILVAIGTAAAAWWLRRRYSTGT